MWRINSRDHMLWASSLMWGKVISLTIARSPMYSWSRFACLRFWDASSCRWCYHSAWWPGMFPTIFSTICTLAHSSAVISPTDQKEVLFHLSLQTNTCVTMQVVILISLCFLQSMVIEALCTKIAFFHVLQNLLTALCWGSICSIYREKSTGRQESRWSVKEGHGQEIICCWISNFHSLHSFWFCFGFSSLSRVCNWSWFQNCQVFLPFVSNEMLHHGQQERFWAKW